MELVLPSYVVFMSDWMEPIQRQHIYNSPFEIVSVMLGGLWLRSDGYRLSSSLNLAQRGKVLDFLAESAV